MHAFINTLQGTAWSKDSQRVTTSLSQAITENGTSVAILSVFDSDLSLRAFSSKLSEVTQTPFSVKEMVTKKGEVYFRVLLNPSYSDTSIGFSPVCTPLTGVIACWGLCLSQFNWHKGGNYANV